MTTRIIAITGGIGAGKSIVSKILRASGYSVYDCDSEAKRIMDTDTRIKSKLISLIHPSIIKSDGTIDRPLLSDIVFNSADKLAVLNSIVHGAVKDDVMATAESMDSGSTLFVESAIVYASGLNRIAGEIWEVTAPEKTRIERVMRRNAMSYNQVKARINSQKDEFGHPDHHILINDGISPVLPQLDNLLRCSGIMK